MSGDQPREHQWRRETKEDRVAEAVEFVSDLLRSPRTRDDYVQAVLALKDAGHGTFIAKIPRASGKPHEGALIMGGLALRLTEERDL